MLRILQGLPTRVDAAEKGRGRGTDPQYQLRYYGL